MENLQSNNGNFGLMCSLNKLTMSLTMFTRCAPMYSWYCGQSLGEIAMSFLWLTKHRNSVPG